MRRLLPLLLLTACLTASRNPPPASFIQSTADAQVTRVIDVRDGLTHAQALRLVTDALTQRFTVEVSDAKAGFVMTSWHAGQKDGVPDLRYRTRVSTRFLGDDWRRIQLRGEANWARGSEWDIGYDAAQLDSVAAELKARLARR